MSTWTSGLMCAKSYGSEFEGITIHRMIFDSMRFSPLFSEAYPLLSEKRPFLYRDKKGDQPAKHVRNPVQQSMSGKVGALRVFEHHCVINPDFKEQSCKTLCFSNQLQDRNRNFLLGCSRWSTLLVGEILSAVSVWARYAICASGLREKLVSISRCWRTQRDMPVKTL